MAVIQYGQPLTSEDKHSGLRSVFSQGPQTQTAFQFAMRARRTIGRIPPLLCLLILTSSFHVGQSIWSLSIPHQVYIVGSVGHFCTGIQGLTPSQKRLCADPKNRGIMATIRYGAQLAIKECQYQFQYRRWNCSVPAKDSNSLFRHITDKGTREAAFTYAISSAGVVHSIARACVEGNLSLCGCSRERRPPELDREYQWGGCGDNIEYGSKFTKQFMNSGENDTRVTKETKEQEKTLMNLHNIEAGIRAVEKKSRIVCKCHGMSGSCSIQTCQRELAELKIVGEYLHMKYDEGVKVRLEVKNPQNRILQVVKQRKKKGDNRRDNSRTRSTNKKPPVDSLVYVRDSPNYCVRGARREFPGTYGRTCNINSNGSDSCRNLCCKRGYDSAVVTVKRRCKCKFHWCCEIRCKVCENEKTRYTCR